MIDEIITLIFIAAVTVLVVGIAKLASFFGRFRKTTQSICRKMDRADTYNEYYQWRRELCCHYLTLIPFVNQKNAYTVYRFFYKGKHRETAARKDSLLPLLMPSLLGICVCVICICGMTWAWYSANVQISTQKVTAAYYEVEASIVEEGSSAPIVKGENGYALTQGSTYRVTLTAHGSVEKCGGYCIIENETKTETYYTESILPDGSITFAFSPKTTGIYTFIGVWGSRSFSVEDQIIKNGDRISASTQNDNAVLPEEPVQPDEPTEDTSVAVTEPTESAQPEETTSVESIDSTESTEEAVPETSAAVHQSAESTAEETTGVFENIDSEASVKEEQPSDTVYETE